MAGVVVVKRGSQLGTKIPDEWRKMLEENVVGPDKEYASFAEYLRDLIREDMKRRGLFRSYENEQKE